MFGFLRACTGQEEEKEKPGMFAGPPEGRQTIYSKHLVVEEEYKAPVFAKTGLQKYFLNSILKQNFLFVDMAEDERESFVLAMEPVEFQQGDVIIQQGDENGDYFYIVSLGTVNFVKNGQPVGSCSRGGSFGELALLYHAPRAASCIADTAVSAFRVDQHTFRSLLVRSADDHHADIRELIRGISVFKDLDSATLNRFTRAMAPVAFRHGHLIVEKGQEGNVFYIVQKGIVKIHDIGLGDSKIDDVLLQPGDWFGERALLTGEPRVANATSMSNDTVLLAIDRETFEATIGPLKGLLEMEMRKTFLQGLDLFKSGLVSEPELNQLVGLMKEVTYEKGEKLAETGQAYDKKLWIIRHGRLLVYGGQSGFRTEKKEEVDDSSESSLGEHKYDLQTGDVFGEKSVACGDSSRVSSHTAVCAGELTAWVLSIEDIESVVGDVAERLNVPERRGHRRRSVKEKSPTSHENGRNGCVPALEDEKEESPEVDDASEDSEPPIDMNDLVKHCVLGRGTFGKVWLVEHRTKDSPAVGTAYALKSVQKLGILEAGKEEPVLREKEVLLMMDHPFVLQLVAAFQDPINLYLLLPLIPGGELYSVLSKARQSTRNHDRGLPNDSAAFYSACVIEALGHFHQRSIAYRDLKLENVLIDEHGYCIVVDLGFAKVVDDKTFTLVGTPEYLAPEIILSKGHDKAADCWSFGILVYELLVGVSPFSYSESQIQMFKNIIKGSYDVPLFCSRTAADLIEKLLVRKQMRRLGNLSHGYLDVKNHAWYEESGIDFTNLLKKKLAAPWVPEVKNPLQDAASNFGDFKSLEQDEERSRSLTMEEQEVFKDF